MRICIYDEQFGYALRHGSTVHEDREQGCDQADSSQQGCKQRMSLNATANSTTRAVTAMMRMGSNVISSVWLTVTLPPDRFEISLPHLSHDAMTCRIMTVSRYFSMLLNSLQGRTGRVQYRLRRQTQPDQCHDHGVKCDKMSQ
ncbi:hypothetical protein GWO43_15500 [candidate division KSB1 bacterium]|nr:hypothetical protein [candidate division KSB1 bacterium]NIR72019.1 hypothetical protein [candidate division KSB1 bacterium]NIT72249.1 hypothetical protein [candidate division KSB1 bacterium]NIU26058.1 hypothetical protein [candidate division KSB1 bacterium]NIW16943.1 hypothetical protein [candidate division KSB1 bacterium]